MTGEQIRLLAVWFYNANIETFVKGIYEDNYTMNLRQDYYLEKYRLATDALGLFLGQLDGDSLNRLAKTLENYNG